MVSHKTAPTFTATIYVGTKERFTGTVRSIEMAKARLQEYCDRVGLCVTVTPTDYIYTNGNEPGFAVGLINYPRFPSTPERLRATALEIAEDLCNWFHQGKVTVVFPNETVMVDVGLYGMEPENDAARPLVPNLEPIPDPVPTVNQEEVTAILHELLAALPTSVVVTVDCLKGNDALSKAVERINSYLHDHE